MATMHNNLTEGSVTKQLIRFAVPFLIANILQSLYSIVDMIIVGAFMGSIGISALTVSSQITNAIGALIMGFSVGGTILVSQYIGAKRQEELESTIGTMLSSYAILAVIFTSVMLLVADPLLQLLNTPAEAFAGASSYLKICIWGIPFLFGYNAISAMLRGMGDSKRPMYFIAIAMAVNTVLALLFVGVMRMGTSGAALATFIAQGICFALALLYLIRKREYLNFTLQSLKIKRGKLKVLFSLGLPSGVQQALVQCSFLMLTSLINTYGLTASAVSGIGAKINGLAILPLLAVSTAISSMAGQNIGAGLPDRAMKAMVSGIKLMTPVVLVIFLAINMFPEAMIRIFSSDPNDIAMGIPYLHLSSGEYVIAIVLFCTSGLIQGAGYTNVALFNSIMSAVLLRIPLAYLFSSILGMGMNGIALAVSLAPVGAGICATVFVLSGKWRKSKIINTGMESNA